MSKFVLKTLSVYNYTGSNAKITGTCKIMHEGTEMEMQVKLNEEDAARILEVFADRISDTMGMAARSVLEDVKPVEQIAAPTEADVQPVNSDDDFGDDVSF